MQGTKAGTMVSTNELQEMVNENPYLRVSLDHQAYEVARVVFFVGRDHAEVVMDNEVGPGQWHLEVGPEDYDEPIWEIA
jgi:hypothetical protein